MKPCHRVEDLLGEVEQNHEEIALLKDRIAELEQEVTERKQELEMEVR